MLARMAIRDWPSDERPREKLVGCIRYIHDKPYAFHTFKHTTVCDVCVSDRDEYVDPSWDIESPRLDYSVLTGRSLKEIEKGKPVKSRSGRLRV